MNDANTRRFDFDIEGHQLKDVEGTARRARVLARLQAKYPDLYISISLPGWLLGFDPEGMNLLNTTVTAGVRIDMVNVMAQSFGVSNLRTMVPSNSVGEASLMTFRAAANQMTSIFRNKTQSQLYAMMGITPMIGKNDDGSSFTLDDAQMVANFAKQNGVGMISYWSFQRDRAQAYNGSTNLSSFSGVAQSDFQFYNIFKSSGGFVASASTPAPTQQNAIAGSCSAAGWSQGKQYAAGSIVTYSNNKLYKAKFANPGYNPTISTYYWSQYFC
jgi:chitinase